MGSLLRRVASTLLLTSGVGVGSVALAAEFSPAGPFTSAAGTLTIRTPSTFGSPLTCGLTVAGNVSAFTGVHINTFSITGPGFCSLLKTTVLGWRVNAFSPTSALVDDVGFSITIPPATHCGPNQIYASWNYASHQLTVFNQALSGNCTLERMELTLPTLSIAN
ncbi:alkane oxidation protein activator PraB [Pseudomonas synxantha]|uniref:alkane oxidation protein activator PraB n=1 Tax=Pseudomonas synxantha TaxID=47883 RepID=UPI000F58A075|nr:alkane oxidation protein activator PraB [Pseudomonas synxantha]